MLKQLFKIENDILTIVKNATDKGEIKSMFIDYHAPIVERLWFPYEDMRIYLHKIHSCNESLDALFHPHPWESAVRILKGSYETGIGHSSTNEMPAIDCKLIVHQGTCYEMTEKDGWHYVKPWSPYVYSLMITRNKFNRAMPIEPDKKFRELTHLEMIDIIMVFNHYYTVVANKNSPIV